MLKFFTALEITLINSLGLNSLISFPIERSHVRQAMTPLGYDCFCSLILCVVSVSTKIQRRGVFSFFSSVHVGVGYNGRQKNKSNQKNKSIQQMDCGTLNSYPTFAEQAIGFFCYECSLLFELHI